MRGEYTKVITRPDPRLLESWCGEGVAHDHQACGLGSMWDSSDPRELHEAAQWALGQTPQRPTGPGMPGDGSWFDFLGRHKRKMTDVECPNCETGSCRCLGVLVPICAEDDEDWPCNYVLAFLAGRMSGLRLAASKLEGDADVQPTAARMNLLRRLATELENEANRISRSVEEIGDMAPEPSTMSVHWERS